MMGLEHKQVEGGDVRHPPVEGLVELTALISLIGRVERERPDNMGAALMEASHALFTVAKAIRRGCITASQLADVRKRRGSIEESLTR